MKTAEGWNKMLGSITYYKHMLLGWPDWEKDETGEPYFVTLKHEGNFGEKQSHSHALREMFDDVATGYFWSRDFTSDGIPIVRKGKTYESIFVFQFQSDKDKFLSLCKQNRNIILEIVKE